MNAAGGGPGCFAWPVIHALARATVALAAPIAHNCLLAPICGSYLPIMEKLPEKKTPPRNHSLERLEDPGWVTAGQVILGLAEESDAGVPDPGRRAFFAIVL